MKISQQQRFDPVTWSGLTTENMLGSLYNERPQVATDILTNIYTVDQGIDLNTYISQFKPLYMDSDRDFTWRLAGPSEKNIPLVSASVNGGVSNVAATDKAGINFSKFILTFPEQYFTVANYIVGEKNEKYVIRIVEKPTPNGANWDYLCELSTGDPKMFVPFAELQANKRFSKDYSAVESTMAKEGGGVHYSSTFEMINQFSRIRMDVKHPGNMVRRPLVFSLRSDDGKKTFDTWMDYADYQFDTQFRMEKNRALMFGTSNKTEQDTYKQIGPSGFHIKLGAGIRQQMSPANSFYYNDFTIKWFSELLLGLSVGKLKKDKRKFVVRSGEWGINQFSLALENHATLFVPSRENLRIYKAGGENALGYMGQFLEYHGPNGVQVTLMHEPMYDDNVRNKIYKSDSQGLAESFRYDILDMGYAEDGEANIRLVYVKGQEEIMAYKPGLRDPYSLSGKAPKMVASLEDSYEFTRYCPAFAAMVKNPVNCMQVIPSELQ